MNHIHMKLTIKNKLFGLPNAYQNQIKYRLQTNAKCE